MSPETLELSSNLFETDETGWLERMAELIRTREIDQLDLKNLEGYLIDMAKRDKREAISRLLVLIVHLLKWEYQPEKRSASWRLTIKEQRIELNELLESGTLRNHAEENLPKVVQRAVERAAVETGIDEIDFVGSDTRKLDAWLDQPLTD